MKILPFAHISCPVFNDCPHSLMPTHLASPSLSGIQAASGKTRPNRIQTLPWVRLSPPPCIHVTHGSPLLLRPCPPGSAISYILFYFWHHQSQRTIQLQIPWTPGLSCAGCALADGLHLSHLLHSLEFCRTLKGFHEFGQVETINLLWVNV